MPATVRRIALVLIAAALLSCTLNPATGQRQLTLFGEQQEVAMGRDNDQAVQAQYGLYPDEALQSYVDELGKRLAASSERPQLPWQFRVVDDAAVNAFALPGGFIYVTRGILAHFSSEAELASVLGHEIGHVTARHSVEQISRAQLAQVGLGVAVMASEEFRDYAPLAAMGVQVLFLKFGRDDEKQSDDLGMRYMRRAGFDPREMPGVFEMLGRQTALHGGQRLPEWQSTHPNPDRRAERMREAIAAIPAAELKGVVHRNEYLKRLDGLVFGADPRQGYAIGSSFYHPEMAFRIDFPDQWKVINQRQAVIGLSPEEDALIVLSLAEGNSPAAASQHFFAQEGVEKGPRWRGEFYNFRTTPKIDPNTGAESQLRGLVGFVSHQGRVFRLLGYAGADRWGPNATSARESLASFRILNERRHLDVTPKTVKIVPIGQSMTLAEFQKKAPSTIELEELAVLNGVRPDERLAAGTLVKRVVGEGVPSR